MGSAISTDKFRFKGLRRVLAIQVWSAWHSFLDPRRRDVWGAVGWGKSEAGGGVGGRQVAVVADFEAGGDGGVVGGEGDGVGVVGGGPSESVAGEEGEGGVVEVGLVDGGEGVLFGGAGFGNPGFEESDVAVF